jgi:hypothetical protein
MRGRFRPEEILRILVKERVKFVVGGDYAGVLRGASFATADLDLLVRYDPHNLGRLSRALRRLGARVWAPDVHEGLAFDHDAYSLLRWTVLNLVTRHGRLDVVAEWNGVGDYDQVLGRATLVQVDPGLDPVVVLTVEALIAAKEAAGRDKDQPKLDVLRRLHRERR